MSRVVDTVARIYSIEKDDLFLKGGQKLRSDARGLFCFWCSSELDLSLTDLARKLEMTVSGVGYAIRRGEKIAKQHQYRLIE